MIFRNLKNIVIFVFVYGLVSYVELYPQIPKITNKINFSHLSINDGLSQGTINCIFQDSRGFIWFGTNNGLNKYDGNKFTVYKSNPYDTSSLSNDLIISICEDLKGDLWIGTADGLNKFIRKTESFSHISLPIIKENVPDRRRIFSLFTKQKESNFVYLSTIFGLFKLNIDNNKFDEIYVSDSISILYKDYINSIYQDRDNKLWLGSNYSGIYVLKNEKLYKNFRNIKGDLNSISANEIKKIIQDTEGNIWIGNYNGLNKINFKDESIKHYIPSTNVLKNQPDNIIGDICIDDKNNIYAPTSGAGLYVYNIEKDEFSRFISFKNDISTISSNVLKSVFVDNLNTLWIGTNGNGIDYYNPFIQKFSSVTYNPQFFRINSVRTFYQDNKNKLYVGGYTGLEIFDSKSNTFNLKYNESDSTIPNANFYTLCEDKIDSKKFLWVGSEGGGVYRYDLQTRKLKLYKFKKSYDVNNDCLAGAAVFSLFFDETGYLWIGTELGLNIFDTRSEKFIKRYFNNIDDSNSIGPNFVTSIFRDSYSNMWIGTDFGGLNLLDETTGNFKRFHNISGDTNSLVSNFVKCIFQDSKNNLWIGTMGGGMSKFNYEKNTFKNFVEKDGLPNNVVYGILEDNKSNLWLSTNHGISKYNPSTNTFRNYDFSDGLQGNEFNTSAYYKSKDGKMYFGGTKGFTSFYPEDIKDNIYVPPVVFTDFYIYDKKINPREKIEDKIIFNCSITETKEIELNYLQNYFTIEYASLSLVFPQKINYSYILEGLNDEWVNAGNDRTATFTNLDPGEYIFKVKATNSDGVSNNNFTQLKITIVPPFWKTLVFKIIILLLIILIIFYIIYLRTKSIKKRNIDLENIVQERTKELKRVIAKLDESNKTKDKFFSIIAHDIKGALFGLLGFSEILYKDYNDFTDEEKIDITKNLYNSSEKLRLLIENLLNWARVQTGKMPFNPEKVDLNIINRETVELMQANFDNKKIRVLNNINKTLYAFADRNILSSVFLNILSNAVKFSNPGDTIEINSDIQNDFIQIKISDTGIGISKEELNNLFKIDTGTSREGTNNEFGTGLGLIYCKEVIEMSGGKIWIESEVGKGTNVFFTVRKYQ